MNKPLNTKANGFTIIEVVLVLAIAGLIFLMVFIALPALQRGQRDTQRRDSLATFASQITSYQTNNKGRIPAASTTACTPGTNDTDVTCFVQRYMSQGDSWNDPLTGSAYVQRANIGAFANAGDWAYDDGAICNGEAFTTTGANARNFAVAMRLEGGSIACQDNRG